MVFLLLGGESERGSQRTWKVISSYKVALIMVEVFFLVERRRKKCQKNGKSTTLCSIAFIDIAPTVRSCKPIFCSYVKKHMRFEITPEAPSLLGKKKNNQDQAWHKNTHLNGTLG